MKTLLLTFLISLLYCNVIIAQCDTSNAAFNAIITKYEKLYREIEPDTTKGPWSRNMEVGWAGDIDIRMQNKKIGYDLVSVTMKHKKISFNTPQATMRQKKLVFKSIETTMENKTVGYNPVITCRGLSCKTEMKPIITKVPVVKTVTKTVSTDIPEFKYSATSFTTKVPEFRSDRKEIILKLPEVTVITASSHARAQKEEAEKLKEKYETISVEQKKEMISVVIATFDCQKNEILIQRTEVSNEFNAAISELDKSIENLTANGLDPASLTTDDGTKVNLVQLKNDILLQYQQVLSQFDDALKQLLDKEKEVIESME
jgi:hypothetical protein